MDSLAAWVHWSITLAFSPALLACTLCTASVYVKYDHSSQIPDTPSLPHALPPSSKSLRLEQQICDTTLPYLTLQCIEWVSEWVSKWVSELHCFPCSQTASAATHIHSEQRSSGRISEKWVSEWVNECVSECEWVNEWEREKEKERNCSEAEMKQCMCNDINNMTLKPSIHTAANQFDHMHQQLHHAE